MREEVAQVWKAQVPKSVDDFGGMQGPVITYEEMDIHQALEWVQTKARIAQALDPFTNRK